MSDLIDLLSPKFRLIGHFELAKGVFIEGKVYNNDTRKFSRQRILYMSVPDAIYAQMQGKEVEIHFQSTLEDSLNLSAYAKRVQEKRKENQ